MSPYHILSPLPSAAISPHISGHRHFFLPDPLWDQGSCPLHTKVDISTGNHLPMVHTVTGRRSPGDPSHLCDCPPSIVSEISVPGGLVEIITGQMTNIGLDRARGSEGVLEEARPGACSRSPPGLLLPCFLHKSAPLLHPGSQYLTEESRPASSWVKTDFKVRKYFPF